MGGHDQSDLLSQLLRIIALVTNFGETESAKLAYPPSLYVLAFHNVWEDHNMDAHVNTTNDTSLSDKNLIRFGPVTPEFCRCICAWRAVRWALPCM